MAGLSTGPAPKRAAERNRANVPATGAAMEYGPEQFKNLPFEVGALDEPPPAADDWHDTAKLLYNNLTKDPARIWMGPYDWALAYLIHETISRELKPQVIGIVEGGINIETGEHEAGRVAREVIPIKGATITAFLKWAMANGITEAGRLSIRKEISFYQAPTSTEASEDDVQETREGFFSIEGGLA